jgi:hypothetical protein
MKTSVKAKWLVRFDSNSKLLVKLGDLVDLGQELLVHTKDIVKTYDLSMTLSKFHKDCLVKMQSQWSEKLVNTNDILINTGGLMPKKLFCPDNGIFVGVDEFLNLKIKVEEGEKRTVFSPVSGKVVKIDKEKISIEFSAFEIKGRGIVQGKCWGDGDFKPVEKISELNYEDEGKVIMSHNIDKYLITKAEVVGVTGVIVLDNGDEYASIESALPILALNQKDWAVLVAMGFKSESNYRVLLNAKLGRLLIVKK